MSTFDYKSYRVTVDTDVTKFFPGQPDAVRGIFSIWQPADGDGGRQVYRGQTGATFPSSDLDRLIAAAEEAARSWIDTNGGKPWA